jgi:hypothetical protein
MDNPLIFGKDLEVVVLIDALAWKGWAKPHDISQDSREIAEFRTTYLPNASLRLHQAHNPLMSFVFK